MKRYKDMDIKEKEKISYVILAIIGILVLAFIIFCVSMAFLSDSSGSSSSSDSLTCKVCGRSFSDSANKKSIRSTNMCSNCYRNYSYVSGLKYNVYEQENNNSCSHDLPQIIDLRNTEHLILEFQKSLFIIMIQKMPSLENPLRAFLYMQLLTSCYIPRIFEAIVK